MLLCLVISNVFKLGLVLIVLTLHVWVITDLVWLAGIGLIVPIVIASIQVIEYTYKHHGHELDKFMQSVRNLLSRRSKITAATIKRQNRSRSSTFSASQSMDDFLRPQFKP